MINDHTLKRFRPLGSKLVHPLYDGYSFASLPATIEHLLTGAENGSSQLPLIPADCFGGSYPTCQKVVLIFIDSFGMEFWQQYHRRSALMGRVISEGILTPISALFPSTTSASVSTLNFGVLPASHAVYEWNLYVPAFGETIQSLTFETLGRPSVPCVDKGYDPQDMICARETLHQRLSRHGVRSIQLAHKAYASSPYNRLATKGAEVVTHAALPEALGQLREAIEQTNGPAFIHFYWATLDTIAHVYGPGSPEHEAEVLGFWQLLDDAFHHLRAKGTLVLFTADHGHVGARAQSTLYINECWPALQTALAVSPTGTTIWPNGSPRDMFLHVKPEQRDRVMETLSRGLDGVADVLPMERALAEGLFGHSPVSPELRARLGDILVLPHLGHFIWWREPGIMANRFNGHHGGLTAEEMTTVLGVLDLA